jgi:hypothetical protein
MGLGNETLLVLDLSALSATAPGVMSQAVV